MSLQSLAPYVGTFRVGVLTTVAYRRGLWYWAAGEAVLLVIMYFLWSGVFAAQPERRIQGFGPDDFFLYLVVARLVSRFTSGPAGGFYAASIRTGAIAYDLAAPVVLPAALYTRWLGQKVALVLFILPLYLLALVCFRADLDVALRLPPFVVSLLLAHACAFAFEYLVGLVAFYTNRQQGIDEAKSLVITLLSGSMFPLSLLPDAVFDIVRLLPFQAFVFLPAQLLSQHLPSSEVAAGLLTQCGWTAAFLGLGALLTPRALTRAVIQGG